MRAVIQRVTRAAVAIGGRECARIDAGLLVLLGVAPEDGDQDSAWLAGKIARLRIFADAAGKMNLDVRQAGGRVCVVSQFTLFASTAQGNRPGFTAAAPPAIAIPRYQDFLARLEAELGQPAAHGEFGADMQVELVNDGPVTLLIDSRRRE